MMNASKEYRALAWFVAGYLEAADPPQEPIPGERWAPGQDQIQLALTEAQSAIEDYCNGVCLSCGAEGVVIIDGYFCERCCPGIEEVIE